MVVVSIDSFSAAIHFYFFTALIFLLQILISLFIVLTFFSNHSIGVVSIELFFLAIINFVVVSIDIGFWQSLILLLSALILVFRNH